MGGGAEAVAPCLAVREHGGCAAGEVVEEDTVIAIFDDKVVAVIFFWCWSRESLACEESEEKEDVCELHFGK